MQVACLVVAEGGGCKLSNDCFTMLIVLPLVNLMGHVSLKWHEKSTTNMYDSFCSNSEIKNNFIPFPHILALRYKGDITYGIRAKW